MTQLFHVSECADITRFDPRPSGHSEHDVVWAIEADRLCNYLLPRECPRVTFYATTTSTAADIARFLDAEKAIVAIEERWRQRVETAELAVYQLPAESFVLADADAGYWISREPVVPLGYETLTDLPAAIAAAGASLRILPSLWTLHDEVAASSLNFSMIRMRNAAPRQE